MDYREMQPIGNLGYRESQSIENLGQSAILVNQEWWDIGNISWLEIQPSHLELRDSWVSDTPLTPLGCVIEHLIIYGVSPALVLPDSSGGCEANEGQLNSAYIA